MGSQVWNGWRWVHKTTRNASSQGCARKRLLKKRGERCEKCGNAGPVEMHHKTRAVDGGTFDDDNLILLCKECHKFEHRGL